jgi:diguanylate cyclase (GGDEF)-like protein/PAS domain S-box-containing protein
MSGSRKHGHGLIRKAGHPPAKRVGLAMHLRAQNAMLQTALDNMLQGLCLFDREKRVIVANRRYAELYGLDPHEVRPGTHLRSILEARARKGIYRNIDAHKFVEDGVGSFNQKVAETVWLADGRVISVLRLPMPDGGLISTHEDVTERKELHSQLALQHERLDAALEQMMQGLAMFDRDLRLIVCNRRYAEMYGLTREQLVPGTTLEQIFAYRRAAGTLYVRDTEKSLNQCSGTGDSFSARIQELPDGRIISISRRQLAHGGRLVTHEDITERHRLGEQLERQHKLLQEQEEKLRVQNLQLDAALNNMVQGLAMFDRNSRIVLANARYAELYGLTSEDVRPGTPLRRIIERRIAQGHHEGRTVDEAIASIIARTTSDPSSHYINELGDGRSIAVSTSRMPDGGTVTTHHDITDQRRSEAKIAHMALHDALTGLPNRALLNERVDQALARAERGEIVAIHLLDLDRFKTVNDTLGHPVGDQLLKCVAERLNTIARSMDTIARMGGDEFAIVQAAISQPSDAIQLAQRIIGILSEPYEIETHQVVIGASIGIAIGPGDGVTPDQIMRNADLALYRAKDGGRGTFRFFEPEMDAQMRARRSLESDLRKALPAGQLELHYQPVVDLSSNAISGFEALLRWRHSEKGLIPPGTFVPLAEELGLIVPIGDWVLREACATAAGWPAHLKVAVNLSSAQFTNPGLLPAIVGALAASRLAPDRLELEITETILLHDSEATLATLFQLRELGVRIAMDDFGTGYSSLSYLQSFPFDKIKIDRSFVSGIAESTGSLNIVRAVAALANGLGMAATAEGVETQAQLETIRSEGCTEMQGFLFSQAVPADAVLPLLQAKGCLRAQDDDAAA